MSHLRKQHRETLECAWCGNVEETEADRHGQRYPPRWVQVELNLNVDTPKRSIFTSSTNAPWLCPGRCAVGAQEAGERARIAYAKQWDILSPRRAREEEETK